MDDPVKSLLDQISRLEAQNRLETDRDLRRENKVTIKALHKQVRKAARYRHPWYGLLRNLVALFVVFFGVMFGLLMFMRTFGLKSTLAASFIAAVVLTLLTSIILLMTKHISQATFTSLVKTCLDSLKGLFSRKKASGSDDKTSALPEEPHEEE